MRQWTSEELDRVHPLPEVDGEQWEWLENGLDPDTGVQLWAAVVLDYDYGEPETVHVVEVDEHGGLLVNMGGDERPHRDVCLAVILVSKGLDSCAAMADALETKAASFEASALRGRKLAVKAADIAVAQGMRTAASLLRRGTVDS